MQIQDYSIDATLTRKTGKSDLVDQVLSFEKYEIILKKCILKTDLEFQDLTSSNRIERLTNALEEEQYSLKLFLSSYRELDSRNQTPYKNVIRKYINKVKDHEYDLELAVLKPDIQSNYIMSKRMIWNETEEV